MSAKSEFGRRATVSALDIGSGEFVEFNQTNTNYYDFAQAGLSSGSIPVVFPPQHFENHVLNDGGTVWNVNIDSALNQCRNMGASNEEITLDVVVVAYDFPPEAEVSTTLRNYMAARDIKQYYFSKGIDTGIEAEMRAAVGVNFRYYFQEHGMLCSPNSLNFDGDATWCMQESGRRDAQNALAIGQDNIAKSMKEWNADKTL